MGAVARSSTALQRLLRIAAVPPPCSLAFAIWWLAGWGGQSTMRALIVAGGLGFPAFAAVSAGLAARRTRGRQRQAWVYMTIGLVAWTFSELVVVYHRVWLGSVLPLVPVGGERRVLGISGGRLRSDAGIPGRLSGWQSRFRMLLDGAIVGAVAVRRGLGGGAARCVRRDRCESTPTRSCRSPVRSSEVVTVTVAVLVLARAHAHWRHDGDSC